MKEAFEKIKERLEEKKKQAHDLHGKPHMDYSTLVGWESAMMYALDVVSEVEAEYGYGWIPCSERLPEEPEENPEFEGHHVELYFVSVKDEKYPFRAMWNGKMFTDGLMEVHPEAWMPLPESYNLAKGEPNAKEE